MAADKTRRMARAIVSHHLQKPPTKVRAISGGLTNSVFEVTHSHGALIVRIGTTPEKVNHFIKEQWAMRRAREAGVPVPDVLEVGNEVIERPYMILRKCAGTNPVDHPDRLRIVSDLGRCAARLHSIVTQGFGSTFDWSENQLSHHETWRSYLKRELRLDERIGALEKARMISSAQARRLHLVCRELASSRRRGVLNHGDLRLKNVIVDRSGKIGAIIDWENCVLSAGPQWDLSLALHDLSIDAKEAFLSGYGLSAAAVKQMAPVIKAFNVINYAPCVRDLAARKDSEGLARFRQRLSGALDLYSV